MSKRKRIVRPDVRVSQNAVTHAIETVVLDAPQRAYERAANAIESACSRLPTTGSAPWYALVEQAKAVLAMLEAGEPVPGYGEPLAAIVREYGLLNAGEQSRFAGLLWARFRLMLPHHDGATELPQTRSEGTRDAA